MKISHNKVLAILIVLILAFLFVPTYVSATASSLATQINAIPDITATAAGNTVTVTGTNENITSPLTLNIPEDVTIKWEATYTGTVSPASTSMINLIGSGTFEVSNNGTVINAGTGNTLNITGSGITININTGGTIQSSRSGSAILILTDNVEVNVGATGSVISLDGNANAAIQIGGGSAVSGNTININGGTVISIGTGFAINDGAGTALLDNNTKISITGGIVTAGGNSAVHSTGIRSVVTVSGGIISNAAGNNLNPTIDMQGDMTGVPGTNYNLTVSGSAVVQSTSVNGYTLQTKGNVLIENNAYISAINGRAINLVGLDSRALIRGGTVETTGNGTAVSTATTNVETVVRAAIEVTGGRVSSESGYAINATGANSKVTVSGGSVSTSSATNHAINATGAGVTISVSGTAVVSAVSGDAIRTVSTNIEAVSISGNAKISSITGRAIQANGAGALITVGGPSQIWVLNAGNAIRCTAGTVTLNSGFVFAYGTDAHGAINSPHINVTTGGGALVVVWNEAAGKRIYPQGSSTTPCEDLNLGFSGSNANFWWHNHPTLGGGINYTFPPNVGFFSIPEVSIYRDFGLIFVSATGRMYRNIDGNPVLDGTGSPAPPNHVPFYDYREDNVFPPAVPLWGASPGQLRLHGFSWTTNMSTAVPDTPLNALTIIGDTEIVINGDSRFEATHPSGTGIKLGQGTIPGNENIRFTGGSTLRAVGRNSPGIGIDIGTGLLTMHDGVFIAQAGQAIGFENPPTGRVVADPLRFDYSWKFSKNFDGSDGTTGYGLDLMFDLFETDKFVMFRTVTPVNLDSAVQVGGISHTVDSVAVMLTFNAPIRGLTVEDIEIINNGGIAEKGILSGSGRDWVLTLSKIDAEGPIIIRINPHFDDFFVEQNERSTEIYKADPILHDLIITNTVQQGGNFEQLFEFEIFFADDPREPQPVPLTSNPGDEDAFYVTYANPTSLPPGRITGPNNNILLLKHGEAIKIYGLPIGFYYISEHQNQGFVTAFDIDSEGWFTAPDGNSRIFRLTEDVVVDTFNSIITEEPGEPERPFDPNDPEKIIEPDAFNLILTKTVQSGGDFNQLFEFEILLANDPGALKASSLSTDPLDEGTLYVTYKNGSQLPPGRIIGNDHSILLLTHNEEIMIRNLPIANYMIMEHANDGFLSAFKINSEDWYTAPDGLSRRFRHESETTADCFNSIVPEIPGEPSRPFNPDNPAVNPRPHQPPPVRSPQTGITRNTTFSIIMLIIASIAFTTAMIYRKKANKR